MHLPHTPTVSTSSSIKMIKPDQEAPAMPDAFKCFYKSWYDEQLCDPQWDLFKPYCDDREWETDVCIQAEKLWYGKYAQPARPDAACLNLEPRKWSVECNAQKSAMEDQCEGYNTIGSFEEEAYDVFSKDCDMLYAFNDAWKIWYNPEAP